MGAWRCHIQGGGGLHHTSCTRGMWFARGHLLITQVWNTFPRVFGSCISTVFWSSCCITGLGEGKVAHPSSNWGDGRATWRDIIHSLFNCWVSSGGEADFTTQHQFFWGFSGRNAASALSEIWTLIFLFLLFWSVQLVSLNNNLKKLIKMFCALLVKKLSLWS